MLFEGVCKLPSSWPTARVERGFGAAIAPSISLEHAGKCRALPGPAGPLEIWWNMRCVRGAVAVAHQAVQLVWAAPLLVKNIQNLQKTLEHMVSLTDLITFLLWYFTSVGKKVLGIWSLSNQVPLNTKCFPGRLQWILFLSLLKSVEYSRSYVCVMIKLTY